MPHPIHSGIAVVIPAFKVRAHIQQVIADIGVEVAKIYVVDDCCPDGSGRLVQDLVRDVRVEVLFNAQNTGVGGGHHAGLPAGRRRRL